MEFCPGCGKKSKGICKDCRPHEEIKVKDINIKFCSVCKKYFYKNRWTTYNDVEAVVKKIAADSIKAEKFTLKLIMPEIQMKPGIEEEISIEVDIDDDIVYIPASITVSYCNICSKNQGDYFEGTLQLRNVDDAIINFIRTFFKKNRVFVSKEKKQKNGIDMNVTDKKRIQNLGVLLQKRFGGSIKVSPHIHTQDRQTSKQVYRVNVLYEAADFKPGDVVKIDNKIILVRKISKTISGVDLATGNNASVDLKNKEYKVLKPMIVKISKVHPELEILDPETYQSIPLRNKKSVKLGEKVGVVSDNGIYYIL
ncbi:MAG: NMD3-related protein [Nanoarchaeota archaeon]